MNIHLNIKMKKEAVKNYPIKTNFRPKLSLLLIVIVPVILFDNCFDAMGLDKNHLICIFMNINKNDENQNLQRENILPFEGFGVGYRM